MSALERHTDNVVTTIDAAGVMYKTAQNEKTRTKQRLTLAEEIRDTLITLKERAEELATKSESTGHTVLHTQMLRITGCLEPNNIESTLTKQLSEPAERLADSCDELQSTDTDIRQQASEMLGALDGLLFSAGVITTKSEEAHTCSDGLVDDAWVLGADAKAYAEQAHKP